MANKDFQSEEEIIDLTELIESGETKSPPAAAAAYAKAASAPPASNDDFESLLAEKTGSDTGSSKSGFVDADEQLDMTAMGDIDNLLDSLDIPTQPHETPQATPPPPLSPKPAKPASEDLGFSDLDNVLDDLLGEPKKTSPPQVTSAPEMPDLDADLNDILSSVEPPAPKPAEKSVAKPAPTDDFTADLDDILDEPVAKPAIKAAAKPAPADDFELPPDLDNMLDETGAAPASDLMEVTEVSQPAQPVSLVPASGFSAEMIGDIYRQIISSGAIATKDTINDFSRELGAQNAHFEDLSRQMGELNNRLLATETRLTDSKERIASLEKELSHNNSFEDILKEGTALHTGFSNLIGAAVSNVVKNALPEPDDKVADQISSLEEKTCDASERINQLAERLESLESGLAAQEENDAISNQIAQLEAKGAEDSERLGLLEQRLDSLEPRIAAQEMDNALAMRLDELEARNNSAAERLELIENRLEALAENFNAQVEKAAASAVARVLHEEISRLMSGN